MKRLLPGAMVLLALLAMQAFSYSTASVSDIKLCSQPDSEGNCTADESVFKVDDREIFLSAQINNAPSGTKVTATWNYLRGELGNDPREIDSVVVETEESGSGPFYSSLTTPIRGWPTGDYEVTITLDAENNEPASKQFSVK